MSSRSLSPTAFSVFLEQQENPKEKREGTREWLIFFSRFPTITSHQALGDYNFQAFNSAFTSCWSSSGFGGLWFVCGASRGRELRVRTAFRESFSRSTCKSDEWLSASHQRFFSFCNLICTKSKQGSSASKNMSEWVCIQERERTQWREMKEEVEKKLRPCLFHPSSFIWAFSLLESHAS